MTPAELAHAEAMQVAVRRHCPGMIPILKDLGRNELIEGWRNITGILIEGPPRPRNSITVDIYLENSAALNMNRGAT